LAVAAEDAAREIDAEEIRETPPVLVLSCLKGNAIDWACHRAEVASDAALLAVRIAREDDSAAVARRQVILLFGVLHGFASSERVQEDLEDRHEQTQQGRSPSPVLSGSAEARFPIARAPQRR